MYSSEFARNEDYLPGTPAMSVKDVRVKDVNDRFSCCWSNSNSMENWVEMVDPLVGGGDGVWRGMKLSRKGGVWRVKDGTDG